MKQNGIRAYPTPAHTIYQTSTYPVPTLYLPWTVYLNLPTLHHPKIRAQTRSRARSVQVFMPFHLSRQFSSSNTSTPTPRLLTTFLLLPTLQVAMGPGRAGLLSLICPPTMFQSDARQTRLVGHF